MATSVTRRESNTVSDLLLKVTPPRAPRDLVVRARLKTDDAQLRDRPAIVVQAPAGFGKTSLLAQWRREHLAHGKIVAWVFAQSEDDPQRFVQSLALAVRLGSGRPTFGHTLLESTPGGLEGITSWLAEVAQSALDIVLMVDGADHLPPSTRAILIYLLHNVPFYLWIPDLDLPWSLRAPLHFCLGIGLGFAAYCAMPFLRHFRARLRARCRLRPVLPQGVDPVRSAAE